jgi:hypothetical protein
VVDHLGRPAVAGATATPLHRRTRPRSRPSFDSVHDAWLAALRSADGIIHAADEELVGLSEAAAQWQRPIVQAARSPFRLCFRLEEPAEAPDAAPADGHGPASRRNPFASATAGEWSVRYLLQGVDDPSLLVPAGNAWQPDSQAAALVGRSGFDVREYLLSSLGQASGLCPRIEESLREPVPEGYRLDGSGAFEFLAETALRLEQAGFGVMLPAWWTGRGTKLRLQAQAGVSSPRLKGPGALSLDDLVRFDWRIALGDETLSAAELRQLARLKSPLVRLRGQWVHVGADEIRAALELVKRRTSAPARDVLRMALGADGAAGPVPVSGIEATGSSFMT